MKNSPIPNATVYLSKTTMGVLANQNGAYSINVPQTGTYELIVSCVGYESYSKIIKADGGSITLTIKLQEHPVVIREITVLGKDVNRRQNFDLFLKCFIGKSPNAPFCTIQNPKDLIVFRESVGGNLIAYSVKPLIITNSSLGYRIICDLKNFCYYPDTEKFRFSGYYFFQDIYNQRGKNSRTKRNRLITYYGSRMHFLRALFADSVGNENFEMCTMEFDSCGEKIGLISLQVRNIRVATNEDSMTFDFPNPIHISYVNNHPELWPLPNIFRLYTYTSKILFSDSLQVCKNGYYPDGYNISWGGNMASDRIAELLPLDFEPIPIVE
jgi:hypothetical protein